MKWKTLKEELLASPAGNSFKFASGERVKEAHRHVPIYVLKARPTRNNKVLYVLYHPSISAESINIDSNGDIQLYGPWPTILALTEVDDIVESCEGHQNCFVDMINEWGLTFAGLEGYTDQCRYAIYLNKSDEGYFDERR